MTDLSNSGIWTKIFMYERQTLNCFNIIDSGISTRYIFGQALIYIKKNALPVVRVCFKPLASLKNFEMHEIWNETIINISIQYHQYQWFISQYVFFTPLIRHGGICHAVLSNMQVMWASGRVFLFDKIMNK